MVADTGIVTVAPVVSPSNRVEVDPSNPFDGSNDQFDDQFDDQIDHQTVILFHQNNSLIIK